MSESATFDCTEFDKLLAVSGPVAIVGQQLLKNAAIAPDDIVFPPSYANPSEKKDDPPVYNIDVTDPSNPSKNVCVLDSIASQANRMEPLFDLPEYASLVPQYAVTFLCDTPPLSILNVGHRLADALFRGTVLRDDIVTAFKEYAKGNATELARLGPTSLVFGVWDSRGTGVKIPRLISSIVRAFDVIQLRRSAQYIPAVKYEQEGLLPSGLDGKPADHGLADVPSTHKIGGVQIAGAIRRDSSLNLSVLRALRGADEPEIKKLQRYVLGLALVSLTATPESTLRQGYQLLPKGKPTWKQFLANGEESEWVPDNLSIAEFAAAAAAEFDVKQPLNQPLVFDKNRLKSSIEEDSKKKADKKASSESPLDVLSKLVDALKVSNKKKLNEVPLRKLTEYFDTLPEGPAKAIADSLRSTLLGEDAPEEKAKKLKELIATAKNAGQAASEETPSQRQELKGGSGQ
jgi:CRISPR-associated protein Csb1